MCVGFLMWLRLPVLLRFVWGWYNIRFRRLVVVLMSFGEFFGSWWVWVLGGFVGVGLVWVCKVCGCGLRCFSGWL